MWTVCEAVLPSLIILPQALRVLFVPLGVNSNRDTVLDVSITIGHRLMISTARRHSTKYFRVTDEHTPPHRLKMHTITTHSTPHFTALFALSPLRYDFRVLNPFKYVQIRQLLQLFHALPIRLDDLLIIEQHPSQLMSFIDVGDIVPRMNRGAFV
jgi:hypothetical protein